MLSRLNYPHPAIFILAWFLVDLLTALVLHAARRRGLFDRQDGHKQHLGDIPCLGGIGIALGFALTIASLLRLDPPRVPRAFWDLLFHSAYTPLLGLALGGLIVWLMGLLDDFRPIRATVKLGVLFLVTVLLWFMQVRMEIVPAPLGLLNLPLTFLWIMGTTSALNSLDNHDGVAGGTAAIAALTVFVIAWGHSAQSAQTDLSYVALALAGSALGFLRHNFPPARIFLGDNGSLLVGFLLAGMMVMGGWSQTPLKAVVIPVLILTVPLYDIALSTILRLVRGRVHTVVEAVEYCGRDHISHRLVYLGLSARQTTLSFYAAAFASGLLALYVWLEDSPLAIGVALSLYAIALALIGWKLHQAPLPPQESRASGATAGV